MDCHDQQTNTQTKTLNTNLLVALAGNPNAGKTTLFNALTGMKQKIANYPGVTVERKEGVWQLDGAKNPVRLIDLPGLYSIDATSIDEQIARDVLTGKLENLPQPDALIAVVDATNLERNLYLVTQLLEYKIPVVIALTMVDAAEKQSLAIDVKKLSKLLKVPVIPIKAKNKIGLKELADQIISELGKPKSALEKDYLDTFPTFIGNGGEEELTATNNSKIFARYNFISDVYQQTVKQKQTEERQNSEKIDSILTHKFFGLIILVAVLLFVFQAIFSWATVPMDLLDGGFGALAEFAKNVLPAGIIADFVADGVIAGVGGILIFLPQILLLFLFISILEDTGYMARAAFLMDKLMSRVGLHGKAFLPLMSSFACAIPGIMATRTIENRRDRLATILVAPFMSCSARLPIYALMIAAFFKGETIYGVISLGAVLMLAMYFLGIITAVIVAFILKKTILKSPPPPFVMELPPYRLPNFRTVFQNVFTRAGLFVKRAGTVILLISVILWALAYFPRSAETVQSPKSKVQSPMSNVQSQETVTSDEGQMTNDKGLQLKNSFAGKLGHLIEPAIKPLGFDWKIGVALIASFAAREVLVSTLSIIYNVGDAEEDQSNSLIGAIRNARDDDGKAVWSPLTAVTLMVFFVLAMQCMSTVAIVRRETNSWLWTFFMIGYMTGLAYVAALLTYQIGRLFG